MCLDSFLKSIKLELICQILLNTPSLQLSVYLKNIFQLKHKHMLWALKLEDLKVLKCSPDLLYNVKIGHGQLRLIIQAYSVLPYMGSGYFDQVT